MLKEKFDHDDNSPGEFDEGTATSCPGTYVDAELVDGDAYCRNTCCITCLSAIGDCAARCLGKLVVEGANAKGTAEVAYECILAPMCLDPHDGAKFTVVNTD